MSMRRSEASGITDTRDEELHSEWPPGVIDVDPVLLVARAMRVVPHHCGSNVTEFPLWPPLDEAHVRAALPRRSPTLHQALGQIRRFVGAKSADKLREA